MTYGLNDINLVPARISDIEHRSECNPYNFDNMLPLFTAPMNSIINDCNYEIFLEHKINTIIPRGIDYKKRWELSTKTFVAVGLIEFENFINDYKIVFETTKGIRYVCIDIANGHMKKLIDLCSKAKDLFGGRLLIMAGNIANPETYIDYALAGIDFCRCGIGGGSACTTSANAAIHYGMASLIKKVADYKWEISQAVEDAKKCNIICKYKSLPFIVADGGFDNYDKIIKALALGVDYVMVGKLLAQCEEACGEEIIKITGQLQPETVPIDNKRWIKSLLLKQLPQRHRIYYGMSTKRAQKENKNNTLKTAEGIETTVPIMYTISSWCDNFKSYLRSAMSYTNSVTLEDFKKSKYIIISLSEYKSFYK